MQQTNDPKINMWQGHIEAAQSFPGGITAYLAEKQISSSRFYYWKDKIGAKAKVKAVPSKFVPIEVIPKGTAASKAPARLPDPAWIAELILQLTARMS